LESTKRLYRFKKEERLCSAKAIAELFKHGKRMRTASLQLVYTLIDDTDTPPIQVLISVPKKQFKRAVLRNRLKRRIREAYRLNKAPLLTALTRGQKNMQIALVYTGNEVLDYTDIEESVVRGIIRLLDIVEGV